MIAGPGTMAVIVDAGDVYLNFIHLKFIVSPISVLKVSLGEQAAGGRDLLSNEEQMVSNHCSEGMFCQNQCSLS
jgi:hypothetical protein